MKITKTLLILLLSTSCLIAQDIKQLEKKEINTKDKKEKIDLLYDLAWAYLYSEEDKANEKAEAKAREALAISRKIKYFKGEINALNALGTIFYYSNYSKSLLYYNKQLALSKEKKLVYETGRSYHQLARLAHDYGYFPIASQHCENAINYYKIIKDDEKINEINNLKGSIFKEKNQPDSAIIFYEKVLMELDKKKENDLTKYDILTKANVQLNLGSLNMELMQYLEAEKLLTAAALTYEKEEDNYGLARVNNNLGLLAQADDENDKAIGYFKECIRIEESMGILEEAPKAAFNLAVILLNENDLSTALNYLNLAQEGETSRIDSAFIFFNIGEINFKQQEIETAIEYYLKALEISDNNNVLKGSIFRSLGNAYNKNNNYNSAILFYDQYHKLNDTINYNAFRTFDIKSNLEREKRANTELKAKRKLEIFAILFISITLLLIIISISLVMYSRNKKLLAENEVIHKEKEIIHKEKEIENLVGNFELRFNYAKLEGQDQERERVAADLHDRLGSILATVKLHFQSLEKKVDALGDNQIQYNKANNLLDDACEEVRNISHNMQSNFLNKFGLAAQVNSLATTINEAQGIKVKVSEYGLEERIDNKKERNIYQIIQELVTNVLKHANATTLTITLTRHKEILNIIIEDNGKGFNPDKTSSGIGLQNIEARVHELGGNIDFDTGIGAGTTVLIDVNIGK